MAIELEVKVKGVEKYYVEGANTLEEAKEIIRKGENNQYDLEIQDLEWVEDSWNEIK